MTTYAVVYPDSKQAVAMRRTRAAALAVVEHRPAGAQLVIVETEEKPPQLGLKAKRGSTQ